MIEVYVDDMLVKSIKVAECLVHLDEMFSILRKYKIIINPAICILD